MKYRLLLVVLSTIFLSFNSYALKFTPMNIYLELSEANPKTTVFIENDNPSKKVAIELSATSRLMKPNGKEERVATKDFNIYPPQIILNPKERRGIRVRYIGKSLNKEMAYRLIAEELPIEIDKTQNENSQIKILMKYVAALYVTPQNASANLSIENANITGQDISFTIANSGSKHKIFKDEKIEVSNSEKKFVLSKANLKGVIDENILAGGKRTFTVKWPFGVINLKEKWLVTIK